MRQRLSYAMMRTVSSGCFRGASPSELRLPSIKRCISCLRDARPVCQRRAQRQDTEEWHHRDAIKHTSESMSGVRSICTVCNFGKSIPSKSALHQKRSCAAHVAHNRTSLTSRALRFSFLRRYISCHEARKERGECFALRCLRKSKPALFSN